MKYKILLLLFQILPFLGWCQKSEGAYFGLAKVRLLCETGRFFLTAENNHTQQEIDALPCENCKSCNSSWSSLIEALAISEERKEIFIEIYNSNYDNYGGSNNLDSKTNKVISNIQSQLLSNIKHPKNIANAKTLAVRLNAIRSQILQEQQNEINEIEKNKAEEEDRIEEQKRAEAKKRIDEEQIKKANVEAENQRILTEKDAKMNAVWVGVFKIIVLLSILAMLGALVFVIFKGRKGEWIFRLFSMVVALSLMIIIDVFSKLNLSKFIVSCFVNFDTSIIKGKIMTVIITIAYAGIGYLIAKHIKNVLEQKNKQSIRYFIIIATVLIFFFIRLFVASAQVENSTVLIPNAAFILGFGFYAISKMDNIHLFDDDKMEGKETSKSTK